MATDQTTPAAESKRVDLAALTKRLEDHADGIENVAARAMADDMRLAAQIINRLVDEIRSAAPQLALWLTSSTWSDGSDHA
jgi:hypothetical protein